MKGTLWAGSLGISDAPGHLPPAASSVQAGAQHAESSYPHAVALEDIVPVERWGVQRVNRRWILHRAGERRRAGTQTLRDLFRKSREAQGPGTRQESGQLAATNMSTKKQHMSTVDDHGACSPGDNKEHDVGFSLALSKRCSLSFI